MDRTSYRFMDSFIVFSCVVLVIATVDTNGRRCPTLFCVCKPKSTARCMNHGKDLDFIPELPFSVKKLIFVGNFLEELDRSTFTNISKNDITHLNLSRNCIKFITRDAFTDFETLYSLDLSFNIDLNLNELHNSFQSMQFLQDGELHLRSIFKYREIPKNFFGKFRRSKLGKIHLQQNSLIRINGRSFEHLPHLNTLDASNNDIVTIDLNGLHKLAYLVLDNNNLRHIPNFCFRNGSSLARHLRLLGLKNNNIHQIQSGDLSCASKIEFLHLTDNPLRSIEDNAFTSLRYLKRLHIKTPSHTLEEIQSYAFKSSSLRYLSLAGANFKFKNGSFDSTNIFLSSPQLYTLILSSNRVPSDSKTNIQMFGGLNDLRSLVLEHVGWRFIPGDLFHRLPKLKKLDLSNNYLTSIQIGNPFQKVRGLSYLGLAANKFDTLHENFLPKNILDNLKTMNLARNPYTCDCDLLWYVNWLNKTNITMQEYPRGYYCVMPPEWKSKPLNSFTKDCSQDGHNSLKLILITTCCPFVFICVIIITLYKMRWHIRYWIYLVRTKGRKYARFHNTEYMYEGFIVYCDSDRKWVHEILVPRLEGEQGYKLCIHYRDFQVGKLIVDNIVESMEQSSRIILVLSNAFAKSEWCQFEVLLAHKRFMANGNDDLVVVLLEEVNSSHFTNALKIILTSTTYAVWSEDESGQLLFWSQILSAFASAKRPDYVRINT